MHRKLHLFDIDIPGKITFKVSIFTPRLWELKDCILFSGERDAHWWLHLELI